MVIDGRINRASPGIVAIALLALAVSGCSHDSFEAPGAGESWGLPSVPDGYQQVGAVEFPIDPGAVDYALHLVQDAEGDLAGVFVSPVGANCLPGELSLKWDLVGWSICLGERQVVVASRERDPATLAKSLRLDADGAPVVPDFEPIASQAHARVPGIGSLPISFFDTGFAASYVADGTGGVESDQQSIAVGSYLGPASDLTVLDWWFDRTVDDSGGNSREYSFPALAAADGLDVPTAYLAVQVRGEWVVLVRTTDGVQGAARDWLGRVRAVATSSLQYLDVE